MLSFVSSRMSFIYPLFLTWEQIADGGGGHSWVMIGDTAQVWSGVCRRNVCGKGLGSQVVSDSH